MKHLDFTDEDTAQVLRMLLAHLHEKRFDDNSTCVINTYVYMRVRQNGMFLIKHYTPIRKNSNISPLLVFVTQMSSAS